VAALQDKRQGLPLTPAGFFGSFASTGHARTGFSRLSKAMLEVVSDTKTAQTAQKVPQS
jgi:hypothetical protein